MNSSQTYSITREYSEIIGFQKRAKDSFTVSRKGETITAEYRSESEHTEQYEKIVIVGVVFEICKRLLQFMAENSVRHGMWIEIIRDYCDEHNAGISILMKVD